MAFQRYTIPVITNQARTKNNIEGYHSGIVSKFNRTHPVLRTWTPLRIFGTWRSGVDTTDFRAGEISNCFFDLPFFRDKKKDDSDMDVSSDTTQAETSSSSSSLESSAIISACRTELWAPLLEGLAIDSVAIDIGDDFIDYINEDGLDGSAFPMVRRDSESDWEYDDDNGATSTVTERFPQLSARVQTAIDGYGGSVFPKLSWSAPTDAEWIRGPDGMKCHSLDDIAVLLKASDFAQFDLQGLALPEAAQVDFSRPKLIVKPYIEPWHQTLEFRCFVKKRKLRGVCPRHLTGHLPFLKEMMFGEENGMGKLKTFIEHKVMKRLVAEEYDQVVIDVYKKGERYVVVDLGPWDEELTDPLLFTWEDLAERTDEVEWREVPKGTIPSNASALRKQASRMPVEVAEHLLLHGGDVGKLVDSLR